MKFRIFTFWFLFLIVCSPLSWAQKDHSSNGLIFSFQKLNVNLAGVQLDYGKTTAQNWELRGGLYFHINALVKDDENHLWRERAWGNTFIEGLGLNIQIRKEFYQYEHHLFYILFNIHALKSRFRRKDYIFIGQDEFGNKIYRGEEFITSRIFSWEGSLGLGMKTYVAKTVYFDSNLGVGLNFLYPRNEAPNQQLKLFGTRNWLGMLRYSIGVGIDF